MQKVLLAVDNSNIFVPTSILYGNEARFSYTTFERNFHSSDELVTKLLTGSTPPPNDAFWEKMRNEGYTVETYERKKISNGRTTEKSVDTDIAVRTTEAIMKFKPNLLVLLGGDKDMMPIVRMAKRNSCFVNMWSYKESSSSDLEKECDQVFYIDNYVEDLVFFQNKDGQTESFIEHEQKLKELSPEYEQKLKELLPETGSKLTLSKNEREQLFKDLMMKYQENEEYKRENTKQEEVFNNDFLKETNISKNDDKKELTTGQKVLAVSGVILVTLGLIWLMDKISD